MNARLLVVAAVILATVAVPTAAVAVASSDDVDWEGPEITLAPHEGPNGEYATVEDGEIEVQFDGLNDDARTSAGNVFTITASGDEPAAVWVTSDVDGVAVYRGDDPDAELDDRGHAVTLRPGESIAVGFEIDTTGAVPGSGTFTVHAESVDESDGSTGAPGDDRTPTTPSGGAELVVTDLTTSANVTVGEQATITATVENVGDADGETTIELTVDGVVVDSRTVSVPAGESRTVTFERTFDRPGRYEVLVDDERRAGDAKRGEVEVAEPDEPTARFEVTDARIADDEIETGGTTGIAATVENVGDADGETTVELVVGGTVVDSRTVSVPAGESRTVTFERSFHHPGVYSVSVSGVEAGDVTVLSGGLAEGRLLPSSLQTAAVGPVVVLVLLLGSRRYRR